MVSTRRAVDDQFIPVYEIAQRWGDQALRNGASFFDDTQEVWTPPSAIELQQRFIDGADTGKRNFADKLEDQMRGASQPACLLMAELMFIHLLPLSNVGLEAKLRNINVIGSWAPDPFETPAKLHHALSLGIFNGGAGFNTSRPFHLRFLIRFAGLWAGQLPQQRTRVLNDPWAFKKMLFELPIERATSQRNALLLMLFPKTFEDISSREHKRRIVAAFANYIGNSSDIDRQILSVRAAKSAEYGENFSWYDEGIRPLWDTKAAAVPKANKKPQTVLECVEQLLPEKDDQLAFAKLLARTVTAAHKINPNSWSISAPGKDIRLNIGPNRTLSVGRQKIGAALSGENGEDVRALFDGIVDVTVRDPYAFPGNVYYAFISPTDDVRGFFTIISDRLIKAAKLSAKNSTPYWTSHSVEALELVRDLSGLAMPDLPPRDATAPTERKAWIIRVTRDGKSDTANSLERGDTRIFWSLDVEPGSTIEQIKKALQAQDPEITNHSLGNQAGSIHRFISRVKPDDFVLMPDGSELYFGTVTSDAEYLGEEKQWHRSVNWLNPDEAIDRGDVSPALYSRLRSLLTITEITELLPELEQIFLAAVDSYATDSISTSRATALQLSKVDDDFAEELMLDQAWLNEIVDLLERKRQLIFYGPPGTGKTYLAAELADHLTDKGGNSRLVQFHPSYSYEDFVEGYRPRVDVEGNLSYVLTPGPLKEFATAARAEPNEPFFLIIDEINRGNLAKIFGELYYLLEYRDRSLVLQYGSGGEDEFSLPKNLYVIGTMNTADRSIALVDAAIRRRFYFVEFSPLKAPISGLLERWLRKNGESSEPAALLAELNQRLNDTDYAIGPSYLMNEDVNTSAGLARIWKYSIMPLLIEHFYADPESCNRFELDELRTAINFEEGDNKRITQEDSVDVQADVTGDDYVSY